MNFSYSPKHIFNQISPLFYGIVFVCIFMSLVPILEWPDALDHISRSLDGVTYYPPDLFNMLKELQPPTAAQDSNFFNDKHFYVSNISFLIANFGRLPLVLMVVYVLSKMPSNFADTALFCPPLIFALCSPAQESISIACLLVAAALSNKSWLLSTLLTLISVFLDRSMLPNAAFLLLYVNMPYFRQVVSSQNLMLVITFCIFGITSQIHPIEALQYLNQGNVELLGVGLDDIHSSQKHGDHKFYALGSSLMGLYGWMSIRPYPFWLYYPIVGLIFVIGLIKTTPSERAIFLSLLMTSYLVLWLLPTLSQARYYPLLTLFFWKIIFTGVRELKITKPSFMLFLFVTTILGCLYALLDMGR